MCAYASLIPIGAWLTCSNKHSLSSFSPLDPAKQLRFTWLKASGTRSSADLLPFQSSNTRLQTDSDQSSFGGIHAEVVCACPCHEQHPNSLDIYTSASRRHERLGAELQFGLPEKSRGRMGPSRSLVCLECSGWHRSFCGRRERRKGSHYLDAQRAGTAAPPSKNLARQWQTQKTPS